MANSDDPPFLTVGTEVSAKYRGAFCEATIKVAKKLVKCKVSYSKGNTALIGHEVVKGSLKVGSPVEVRQLDGQYLSATIMKLTDQSTYTVVFDDGDERTLKRSSLCLKGGRHFDKSESLDNLPLTDPENFGTPVLHSAKKPSRKRRRGSQSPSRKEEEGMNGKRPCSYPESFPVGKAVFLENDRRRSCWLPAVIVPAHYVMEESDRTPDTICLRSFKDGRFFASTKDELHDFAPDKEPLLSMLEGDVQPMYMCKPAIERAMAYLDTGELPWDMDLFDKNNEHRSTTPTDEDEDSDEVTAEIEEFNEKLKKFHESKGTPIVRRPTLGQKDLNLFKLYKLVKENGGMEKVTQELKWRSLYLQMGMPSMTNASYAIKQAYKKYLYAFEMHEKGKTRQAVRETPTWQNRRKKNVEDSSSEERERPVAEKPAVKPVKPVVKEEDPEDVDTSDVMSQNNDTKSETSDQESSSQAENSSSNGDDCPSHFEHVSSYTGTKLNDDDVLLSAIYQPGDRIKVTYGKGKNHCHYEAKIIGIEEGENGRDYLVHYNGWNTRYDEWINESRISEKVTGPSKAIRPQYAKKKPNRKKTVQTRASGDGVTVSSAPGSTTATPQQLKRKSSDSKEDVTPTPPLSEKLVALSSDKQQTASSSCPVTPATGKIVNGGPLPPQHPASSAGKSSNGKGNARAAKRRRLSHVTEPQQPAPIFTTTTASSSTANHLSPAAVLPGLTTPPSLPHAAQENLHVAKAKKVESAVATPTSSLALSSTPTGLTTTQMSTNHKHTAAARNNGRVAMASGLNGSVCGSNTLGKSGGLQGRNNVEIKREESFGWNTMSEHSRDFPASVVMDNKPNVMSPADVFGSLLQTHLLGMAPVDAASSLICSERVPGMISGDLKPVIQPVRHIPARHSPSPRNRAAIPLKKNDVDTLSNPETYSSVPQHPVDSPMSSQSAVELSPSPPCSPILPSSLKKFNHSSSSSSSLSSSLSASAPSTSLLGKNGIIRAVESTIQEREVPEEARMDTDESNLPGQDSPSSTSSDNSSEKERSPPSEQHPRSKGSQSPEGKRRWRSYETEEQFEERRKVRRADLNFMVDFSQLPEMTSAEKVVLIQEQMRTIQKKWVELKTEVNNLDRKRRKARKKEREAARLAASQAQASGAGSRRSTSPAAAAATCAAETPPVIVECH